MAAFACHILENCPNTLHTHTHTYYSHTCTCTHILFKNDKM